MKEKIKLILLEMYVSTAPIKPVDKYVNQITDLYTPIISDIKDRIKATEDMKNKSGDNLETYLFSCEIRYLKSLLKKLEA